MGLPTEDEAGSDDRAEVAELFTQLNEEQSEITNLLVSASRMISTYFEIGAFIVNPQELRDLVEASTFHSFVMDGLPWAA